MIDLEEFDFPLDESRIARYPAKERDGSKLMIVERATGKISVEPNFRSIQTYLKKGDHLFYNETKVSKRRVYLRAGKDLIRTHETVFVEDSGSGKWICLIKNSRKLRVGDQMVSPSGNIQFTVSEKTEKSVSLYSKDFLSEEFFDKEGNVPIPPYLKRQSEELDSIRYQTIFAKNSGSVAAPTAGLHMSEGLRHNLLNQGVNFHPLNLEIGFGTFQPLSPENFQTKTLHKEKIHIPKDSILAHSLATKSGERRIAMGTTTLRALEAMVRSPKFSQYNGNLELVKDWDGETDLFLTHKDRIATIDGLITNFHLPKSSLLLLVSAFAGKELILEAYNVALEKNFNFFSYGDVMFII